jgi:hypothetical protein
MRGVSRIEEQLRGNCEHPFMLIFKISISDSTLDKFKCRISKPNDSLLLTLQKTTNFKRDEK